MQMWMIVAMGIALLTSESGDWALPGTAETGVFWGRSLAMLGGTLLLLWSLLRIVCKRQLIRLKRGGWPDRKLLRLPNRIDWVSQLVIMGVFVMILTVGEWAMLVNSELRSRHLIGIWQLVLISPYVFMVVIKWVNFYPINRHIREYVLMGQLSEGLAARPIWSLQQYVSFQLRNSVFIILAPILVILSWRDVVELAGLKWFSDSGWLGEGIEGATILGAGIVFLISPFLLRRVWKTRSFPAGPLREKLEELCGRMRFGYRDLLLWDTYSALANAAVMGVIGPVRYVLLTDSLVENTSDRHIEAVFGHEAGHIKHHHIFFLVLFVVGSILTGSFVLEYSDQWCQQIFADSAFWHRWHEWIAGGAGGAGFLLWLGVFGWVSRRFERQADVFGAVSCDPAGQNEAGDRRRERLSGEGAEVMAGALGRIAFLNGISIHNRSWRHSSIENRMRYLRGIADEPEAIKRFQNRVRWLKLAIMVCFLAGIAGWYWLMKTQGG